VFTGTRRDIDGLDDFCVQLIVDYSCCASGLELPVLVLCLRRVIDRPARSSGARSSGSLLVLLVLKIYLCDSRGLQSTRQTNSLLVF
jgi:hypothetical protein